MKHLCYTFLNDDINFFIVTKNYLEVQYLYNKMMDIFYHRVNNDNIYMNHKYVIHHTIRGNKIKISTMNNAVPDIRGSRYDKILITKAADREINQEIYLTLNMYGEVELLIVDE